MEIPIYSADGTLAGYQIRNPGQRPDYKPRGIRISQCLPHIARITDPGAIFACEGPTDAMVLVEVPTLSACSVIGCWSSTSTPGRDFWDTRFKGGSRPLVACGDHDVAGQAFNQRLANEYGLCYPIKWPANRPKKWDVKDEITQRGSQSFVALMRLALASQPLVRLEARTRASRKAYTSSPVLISTLVEEAGGRHAHDMAGQSSKWYCPLHEDRDDASLTVNDETGSWRCWAGCGSGGPAQWTMAWKSCSYEDALELMKRYV